jgi:hypothetical protein
VIYLFSWRLSAKRFLAAASSSEAAAALEGALEDRVTGFFPDAGFFAAGFFEAAAGLTARGGMLY